MWTKEQKWTDEETFDNREWIYMCTKKLNRSEITLYFVKRLNVQCCFIEIGCLGTYDVE